MAFHKREHSKDITSNGSHATPLPTYYSQQLPRWTSKSAFEDQKAFDVKVEPLDPCYPQLAAPVPRFDDIPLPPRPQRRRLPRRAVMIPWVLAAVFFITTLWFTSIALGVRLFMALQPVPSAQPMQEIRVMINGDMFRGGQSLYTPFIKVSASVPTETATVSAALSTSDESAGPTTTGQLETAPTSDTDPLEVFTELTTIALVPRSLKASPTGFITMARIV